MPALVAPLDEAREHLRVIRQTMERSTKYSTLSGLSGVLIGLTAITAVWLNQRLLGQPALGMTPLRQLSTHQQGMLLLLWGGALLLAIAIEFLCNKRRAAQIGKRTISRLGAHIILAALPAFFTGAVLTYFFAQHGLIFSVWGTWMLCYGLAICAVGLFSVKPVSYLGGAFVLAGALTLLMPPQAQPLMMMLTFGGFHIVYGIAMARQHGW